MNEIASLAEAVLSLRRKISSSRALLVGISGIDACGKGYLSTKLQRKLSARANIALINVDGWLNLPDVRFFKNNSGRHFYEHALRLDEMFARLVLPLKQNRSVRLAADFAEETAVEFRPHDYIYGDIDIILLEGIFLFKRQYVDHFDLKIWIECSFETALQRAVARSQEGLSSEETVDAYKEIYFPAQRVHFENDDPASSADLILKND